MKGLLLKDFYMMKSYCKSYLFIIIIFIITSLFNNNNMFFIYYPSLICSMIPITMLAYDERSHFLQYSASLPISKAQYVSAKYLLGLLIQIIISIIFSLIQIYKLTDISLVLDSFSLILSTLILSSLSSAITFPFMFRFGTEKGRISYYIMIGLITIVNTLFSDYLTNNINIPVNHLSLILIVAGLIIYFLSWFLSIIFFKKREL